MGSGFIQGFIRVFSDVFTVGQFGAKKGKLRSARVPDGGVIFFKAAGPAVRGMDVGPPKVFSPQGGHLHTFSRIHSASAGATIPTLPVNTVNAGVAGHIILGGI
jgi:hypothetical protein